MSGCDLCGRQVALAQAVVEGTMMNVCSECSSYGHVIEIKKSVIMEKLPKKIIEREEVEAIDPNYAGLIRKGRERKGMTQEQLGKAIAEKESSIQKIESGGINPTIKLAKKLEQFLKIKLVVKDPGKDSKSKLDFRSSDLTIGDLVKMK